MRGSEPQDGVFGGSAAAGLKVERGPVQGGSQNGCGFAPHAVVIGSVVINGRSCLPSSLNGAPGWGARSQVNVEHAQRSEHERR
jgi:hypothetical protein